MNNVWYDRTTGVKINCWGNISFITKIQKQINKVYMSRDCTSQKWNLAYSPKCKH